MATPNYQFDDERTYTFDDAQPYRFDDEGGPGRTLLQAATEPFLTALETVREQARAVERSEVPQAPDPFRAVGGVFPGAMAAIGGATELARRALPETLPAGTVVGATEGYAGETLEAETLFPREAVAQVGGLVGGGVLSGQLPRAARVLGRGAKAFAEPIAPATVETAVHTKFDVPGAAPDLAQKMQIRMTDVVRTQRQAAIEVQDITSQIALLEQAGLPVPKDLRRSLDLARERFNVPGPATPEVPVTPSAPEAGPIPPPATGLTRIYHGEGGPEAGGAGGGFFTTSPARAASFGPRVSYVDVPDDVLTAGRAAAREAGSGTASDVLLPSVWVNRAKTATGVKPKVIELPADASTPPPPTEGGPPSLRAAAAAADDPLGRAVVPRPTIIGSAHAWLNGQIAQRAGKAIRAMRAEQHLLEFDDAASSIFRARDNADRRITVRGRDTSDRLNEPWADLPRKAQEAVTDVFWEVRLAKGDLSTLVLRLQERLRSTIPDIVARTERYRAVQQEITQHLVSLGRLKPEQLEAVYLPIMRGRKVVGKQLELVEQTAQDYVHLWRQIPTKGLREFFQHSQRLKGKPKAVPITDVNRILGHAYARASVTDEFFLPLARQSIGKVSPRLTSLVEAGVNEFLGVPGYTGRYIGEWEKAVKTVEAVRTLGGNLGASLQNGTQSVFTLADAGLPAFSRGIGRVIADPVAAFREAQRLGVITGMTKADIEVALPHLQSLNAWAQSGQKLARLALAPFRGSEFSNRVLAFNVGKVLAEGKGLKGEAIVDDAFAFMIKNQFPLTARSGVVTQFKSYPVNASLKLKTYLIDGAEGVELLGRGMRAGDMGIVKQGLGKMAPVTRYFGYGTALFGSEAMLPGFAEDWVHDNLLGGAKVKGAIPLLFGISFARSVGLGLTPIDSLKDLAFFLPGPTVSHTLETASALTAIMEIQNERGGVGYRMSPLDAASGRAGEGYQVAWSPDGQLVGRDVREVISLLVKAGITPAGGVQMDRLRALAVELKASDEGESRLQAPATAREATGLDKPTGRLFEVEAGPTKFLRALGLRPEETEVRHVQETQERNVTVAIQNTGRNASQLIASRQPDAAKKILAQLGEQHGQLAQVQATVQAYGGVEQALKAGVLTDEQRRLISAPLLERARRLSRPPERPSLEGQIGQALTGQ